MGDLQLESMYLKTKSFFSVEDVDGEARLLIISFTWICLPRD